MTDKLPEFVEQWILQNEYAIEVRGKYGDLHGMNVAIDVDDLRDFLGKFVLCDREPVGHATPSNEGDAIVMTVAAMRIPLDSTTPLHAPATKEPQP